MYSERTVTTSVIYGSTIRGQNVQYGPGFISPAVTAATIGLASPFTNLSTFLTTKVTRTRFTNSTGSTTNPTATFSATPANGSALIAVILRTADNTTTTMTGWTQLSNAGAGGVRQAAVFWKRAGASEPTTVTATNATAAAWNMTIIEYGGWATLADPVSISASATVASTTTISVPATGMMAGVVAIVNGTGSWTSATLADDLGTNASYTQFAATTLANCSEIVGYNNYEDASITSAKYTLGTARATNRLVVGWPHNANAGTAGSLFAGIDPTASALVGQVGIEFDTSTIPALNTVSAATLTLKSGSSVTWPSTANSEIFSINSTAIAKTPSNTRTLWRTPTEVAALTKVATRAAGSAYVANTTYAWDSETAFISNINQGSTTRLLVATSEQRTGSLAGSTQTYSVSDTAANHFLTIVHNRLVTIPTVTATATPTISRIPSFPRTIAASATATAALSRIASFPRTIAAAVTASPTLSRIPSFARTIAASVTAVPSIVATYQPFLTQLPRILRLAGRSTITLVSQSTLRLLGRSTLKLPKE